MWLWSAYTFLSTRRDYGMNGPQPIAPSEMAAYCNLKRIIRDDDVDLLLQVVARLDDIWLEDWYRRDKQRRDSEAAGKAGKKY